MRTPPRPGSGSCRRSWKRHRPSADRAGTDCYAPYHCRVRHFRKGYGARLHLERDPAHSEGMSRIPCPESTTIGQTVGDLRSLGVSTSFPWATPDAACSQAGELVAQHGPHHREIVKNPHRDAEWARTAVCSPLLLSAVHAAIGPNVAVENTFLVVKWPGSDFEIPWHQDGIDQRRTRPRPVGLRLAGRHRRHRLQRVPTRRSRLSAAGIPALRAGRSTRRQARQGRPSGRVLLRPHRPDTGERGTRRPPGRPPAAPLRPEQRPVRPHRVERPLRRPGRRPDT